MTRPYVVFAESNIKGGCRVALGPKTIIVGPNGSGKSTVANTVELALTGRVSDIVGRREVAREVDLMALAPGKKGELMARVKLSDGNVATWKVGGKGGKKAKHSVPENIVVPDLALPLRPVYEAVTGSVETARKFFLQYAVGAVSDKDVLDRVPAALHSLYKRATLSTSLSDSTAVDRLLAALEHAKKQAREAKAAAKAAEAASNDTASGLAPLPTEAEEKDLRDALRSAEAARDALRERQTKTQTLAGATEESARLAAALTQAEVAYHTAKAEEDRCAAALQATPMPAAMDPLVGAFAAVLKAHATKSLEDCQCCGQTVKAISGGFLPMFWDDRLASFQGFINGHAAQVAAYEAAVAAHSTAVIKSTQAMNEGKALFAKAQAIAAVVGAGAVEPVSEADMAVADLAVANLTSKLREVDNLKASWAVASRARDGVGEAKKNAKDWEDLAEACVGAVSALLDGSVGAFVSRVQACLPGTDRFSLTLRDGERAVFQFGLLKEQVLHTAMSGAEWSRVTAALAGACAPPPKQVSVVIPEERAFDPMMLAEVLGAFGHLDSQVLITSPIRPFSVPEGWTLIDTATGGHQQPLESIVPEATP